jgi:hypothetical protein
MESSADVPANFSSFRMFACPTSSTLLLSLLRRSCLCFCSQNDETTSPYSNESHTHHIHVHKLHRVVGAVSVITHFHLEFSVFAIIVCLLLNITE